MFVDILERTAGAASQVEGTSGSDPNYVSWTLTLDQAATGPVKVDLRYLAGTAVEGSDGYRWSSFSPASVTFAVGETSKTVSYRIDGDSLDETDEVVVLEVINAENALLAGNATVLRSTGWILDDDGFANDRALYTSDPIIVEGDAGQQVANFDLSLSSPSTNTITVQYSTVDGNAVAGEDYAASSGSVTFAPGQTSATVSVPVFGDTAIEPHEFFHLSVVASNDVAATSIGTAEIFDNDAGGSSAPTINVSPLSQTEGTSGSDPYYVNWIISLDQASPAPITVDLAYMSGTGARAFDGYTWSSFSPSTLTFAAGETSRVVSYRIDGDSVDETDETIVLEIRNPENAVLAGGATVLHSSAWIRDDDGFGNDLALYTSNPILVEGSFGERFAEFELSLSRPHSQAIAVQYATRDGSAVSGEDYVAQSGTVSFVAGQTTAYVRVPVITDTIVEAAENFTLDVSVPASVAAVTSGEALIMDDDAGGNSAPTMSIVARDQYESTNVNDLTYLTWDLHLDQPSSAPITVDVRYLSGTGISNSDGYRWSSFSPTSVTFQPGETTRSVSYRIDGDAFDEVDETIVLEVYNPVNVALAGTEPILRSTGWILDDDGFGSNLALYSSDPILVEGDLGEKLASFELSLSRPATSDIVINYATADGSAVAGEDYTQTNGALTFAAGETSKTVFVPVLGDTKIEPREVFSLGLSTNAPDVAAISIGTAEILDDDTGGNDAPVISVTANSQVEATNANDPFYLNWTLNLDKPSAAAVSVNLRYNGGTADAGQDGYTWSSFSPTSVTFQPGETSKTVSYRIDGDAVDEFDETILLELYDPVNATLAGQTSLLRSTAWILDDDGFGENLAVYVSSPTVYENLVSGSVATFEISLSRPPEQDISFTYQTSNGSAVAGSDYVATSGTVTFVAGQTQAGVEVEILGNVFNETTESFSLSLSPNVALASGAVGLSGTAIIIDNARPEQPPEAADLTGDGVEDILFFNASTRGVGQIQMPDASWSSLGRAGTGWEALATGDFDGDEASDVLWFNSNTKAVGRFDLETNGGSVWRGIGKAGGTWEIKGTGDFDGDGDHDILWSNEALNSAGQYRMANGVPTWSNLGATGDNWSVVAIGDLNGDLIDDILWYNDVTGSAGQFRMAADGSKAWSAITTLGGGWRIVDTGDFNGDFIDDILVFQASSGRVGQFNMSGGTATWESIGRAGSGWEIEGTGDFNGDRLDDILWRNRFTDEIGQYQMTETGFTWDSITSAGSDWDVIL